MYDTLFHRILILHDRNLTSLGLQRITYPPALYIDLCSWYIEWQTWPVHKSVSAFFRRSLPVLESEVLSHNNSSLYIELPWVLPY